MTRRPRKIRINETDYKVISRSKEWGYTVAMGQISYHKQLIEVASGQTALELLDTIIHEVMHGIIQEYGVDMDHRKEEKFVTKISNHLTDVLQKNPKLVEWLSKQSQK